MTLPAKLSRAIIAANPDKESPREIEASEIWFSTEDSARVKKIITGEGIVVFREREP